MTREEAVEKLEAFAPMVVDDTREALDMAIEALQAEPKTGEWEQHDGCVLCEDDDTYFYTCSCCKMAITEAERGLFNFCPNCGAKMKGTEE